MSEPDPRAGQEAARLFSAVQEWVRTSAPHLAPSGPDGTPCSCPVCRVVVGLREADPEEVASFVDSAVSTIATFAASAADLLTAATPASEAPSPDDDASDDDARDWPTGGATADAEAADDSDVARDRRVRPIVIDREA